MSFLLTFLFTVLFYVSPVHAGLFDFDTIATGDKVEIKGGADGRVFAAGWEVTTDNGDYEEGLILVGANITLAPKAKGPVYIFGQSINIDGTFEKSIAVAGQEIELHKTAKLKDSYWFSGQQVWLKGGIPADGKILAKRVVLDGHVYPVKAKKSI